MIIDAKVQDKLDRAGFKKDSCQPINNDSMRFIHDGVCAINCTFDNAHTLELHRRYNGSGADSFGGAKSWPAITLQVAFQADEEKLRERLAIELAQTVHKFMRKVRPRVRRKRG